MEYLRGDGAVGVWVYGVMMGLWGDGTMGLWAAYGVMGCLWGYGALRCCWVMGCLWGYGAAWGSGRGGRHYPRARSDNEGLHPGASAVTLLLAEAGVQHVDDAIDGQRRLRDVCGHHHLREEPPPFKPRPLPRHPLDKPRPLPGLTSLKAPPTSDPPTA